MNLKTVKIKNFRGYGQNENSEDGYYIFNDLNQGLIVMSGFNGFGKTSFYEAIEWCLTDNIVRLNDLRSRKIYNANTLKQSEYLKFISPNEPRSDREARSAEVELEFDNGIIIRRDTRSNFISVSENDRYESTVHVYDGHKWNSYLCKSEEPGNPSEKLLSGFFLHQYFPEWKDQLFKAHFLGQEGMNHFLRSCPPGERRSILMKLLNLTPLEQIFDLSEEVKNSQRLNNKINKLDETVTKIVDQHRRIEEVFVARNWGTVDQYISSIKQEYTSLRRKAEEFGYGEELSLKDWEDPNEVTLSNVSIVLGKIEIKKIVLEGIRKGFSDELVKNQKDRQEIEKLIFLQKRVDLHELTEQVNYLLSLDIDSTLRQGDSLKESIISTENKVVALQEKSDKVIDFVKPLHVEWATLIESNSNKIQEDFWRTYNELFSIYRSFADFYRDEITNSNIEWAAPVDTERFKQLYREKDIERSKLLNDLDAKKQSYRSEADLNQNYQHVLEVVKSYILGNSGKIDSCPVCLNTEFPEAKYGNILHNSETSKSEQLLAIIEYTMSSGNEKLQEMAKKITSLEQEIVACNQYISDFIIKPLTDSISRFQDGYRAILQSVRSVIFERITVLQNQIRDEKALFQTVEKQLSNYEELYFKCLKVKFAEDSIETRNGKLSEFKKDLLDQIANWENEQTVRGYFDVQPTLEEIKESLGLLRERYPLLEESRAISELEKRNQLIQARNDQIDELIPMFEKLLFYKPGDIEQKLLDEYSSVSGSMGETRNQLAILTKYKEDAIAIHQVASLHQQQAIERHLENNKLINWIFKLIFPHPYFRDVRMSGDRNGVNVKSISGEVMLDHIFSSAQLNILALSIFLGLGLTQKFSKWDQLFLDDPIQSMDDIKILSFIDVLRAICDSKQKRRNLIISTHDDNFAKLLAIKFRNKPFIQYNFSGYGAQGPLIERR